MVYQKDFNLSNSFLLGYLIFIYDFKISQNSLFVRVHEFVSINLFLFSSKCKLISIHKEYEQKSLDELRYEDMNQKMNDHEVKVEHCQRLGLDSQVEMVSGRSYYFNCWHFIYFSGEKITNILYHWTLCWATLNREKLGIQRKIKPNNIKISMH